MGCHWRAMADDTPTPPKEPEFRHGRFLPAGSGRMKHRVFPVTSGAAERLAKGKDRSSRHSK